MYLHEISLCDIASLILLCISVFAALTLRHCGNTSVLSKTVDTESNCMEHAFFRVSIAVF